MGWIDTAVLVVYAVGIFLLAQWVSRTNGGAPTDSKGYFLAGKTLPWWAIGTSLIAANISAEQIVGMSGSGYVIGLAIASYEWMSALTLLIVAKFFLPIFLTNNISTMPEFLERRYSRGVCTLLAIFWLGVYIFINLTSILWLGSLAVSAITGVNQFAALVALGAFAFAYQLYGGLRAVALTDIVQVMLLVLGGIIISWICLDTISGHHGPVAGLETLMQRFPDKFEMILPRSSPHYAELPGISVLIGGMWVMNLSYWGFNQYIIQRALAAKSLSEAQKGITLTAFLKLFMPIIVVLPGMAALVLAPGLARPDAAYPAMMKLLPVGLKGLVFAALVAAIIASLASKINSISTIFTLDIYSRLRPDSTELHLVSVGRIAAVVAVIVGIGSAPALLGGFDQAFQFIQEFTGFFTPGIVVIFLFAMFWARANAAGAYAAALGSAGLSLLFKLLDPSMPFMNRVGIVFLLTAVLSAATSLLTAAPTGEVRLEVRGIDYSTSRSFNLGAGLVVVILSLLYARLW